MAKHAPFFTPAHSWRVVAWQHTCSQSDLNDAFIAERALQVIERVDGAMETLAQATGSSMEEIRRNAQRDVGTDATVRSLLHADECACPEHACAFARGLSWTGKSPVRCCNA